MDLKSLILVITLFLLAACKENQPSSYEDTPECMKYLSMMLAPLPPAHHEKLRKECLDSRTKTAK
ncbi:hypothetical protein ACLBWZ_14740 [Brucellaceae bacterium C25G]